MQCPKCGAEITAQAAECRICFAQLDGEGEATAGNAASPGAAAPPGYSTPLGMANLGIGNIGANPAVEEPQIEVRPSYLSPGQPATQPGMGGGEVRYSLTGEAITSPAQSAPYGQPPAGGQSGRPPMPPPTSQGSSARRPMTESAPSKSSGGIIAFIIVLVLLAGGAGGFWFWHKQQAPKVAAEAFFTAFKAKDWKTVIGMIELPEDQKKKLESAPGGKEAADKAMETGLNYVGSMVTIDDFKIESSSITGDNATVKVTLTVSASGMLAAMSGANTKKTSTEDINLILVDGKWKLDATKSGMGGMPGLGAPGGAGRMPKM